MRVLVTGGAGFVGSALVRELTARRRHEVVVLDNFSRGRDDRLAGTGATIIHGDVRDYAAVRAAVQGCDTVAHLAYLQGTQTFYANPAEVLEVALKGIVNVLDACRAAGCASLLQVSSSEAYQVAPATPTPESVPLVVPDPLNPRYSYGSGKIASEMAALAYWRTGILDRVVIARPHNIYGPDMGREHVIPEFCIRMNAAMAARRDLTADVPVPFPIQGSGYETRSFCWIGDCAKQLAFLAADPGAAGIFNVGSMEEQTISDVARAVARCYGVMIKIEPGRLPQGSPPRRLPDTAKIRAAMGEQYEFTAFAQGIGPTVDWYQGHG